MAKDGDKSDDKLSDNVRIPELIPTSGKVTDNKLNGTNYFEWIKTIRLYVRSMGMASHLDSDPPTDGNRDLWLQQDARMFLQIINSIEPSVSTLVNHCESVKELIDYLDFLYSGQSNISRIYSVCKAFHRGEQHDRSLTTYTMEFKKVYEEMNSLLPLSTDVKAMQSQREQIAVISFLSGLRPEFDSIRSQFLNESAIPSLQETFARVLRHEDFQSVQPPDNHSALVSRGGYRGGFRGGFRRGYRGGSTGGHNNRTTDPRGFNSDSSHVECYYCHEMGHTKFNCQKRLARNQRLSSAHSATTLKNTAVEPKDEQAHYQSRGVENPTTSTAAFAETGNSGKCLVSSSSKWVIDSGASDHMTGNPNLLSDFTKHTPSARVTVADGNLSQVEGSGTVKLSPSVLLSSVLSLPNFSFNLMSVSKITRGLKCSVNFFPDYCVFQDLQTKRIIGRGRESDGLYIFEQRTPYSLTSSSFASAFEVHCRLGHPSLQSLKKLHPEFSHLLSLQCESCQFAKHQCVHLSPRVNKRATSPFQLVHSDVWGPCSVASKTGFRYFVTFVDDYSRTTWLYLMKNRSEVFNHLCSFHSEIKTQFQTSIKTLRSDNAKEYLSQSVQSYMLQNGIIHESSCVDTPAQNGVAERKNRHLLEVARALLFQMSVPKPFWADAVATACFLINRMPSVVLNGDTPFSVFETPLPIEPKIFGSTCFVRDTRPNITKLDPKSLKCVFLGYSRLQKGYRCFFSALNRYIVSRDVTFHENSPFFPVSPSSPQRNKDDDLLLYTIPSPESSALPIPDSPEDSRPPAPPADSRPPDPPADSRPPDPPADSRPPVVQVYHRRQRSPSDPQPVSSMSADPPVTDQSNADLDLPIALRKGKRSCTYPIASVVSYDKLCRSSRSLVSTLDSVPIPTTVSEALAHSGWRDAMIDELNALDHNVTWDLVELPVGKQAIGCKWVFTVKVNPDGSVARLKARLVAKGYAQTYGVDYSETFSPVAKLSSIRLFISLAATYGWPLHQLDVTNAFLHGELLEEVYMEQPPGFVAQGECGKVCKLRKSLYGLKQSPRAWFGRFSSVVTKFGLRRSSCDHSVFFASSGSGCILLVVYVDDIVVTGSDNNGIQRLKDFLASQFQTKDLGPLKYFLGIEVSRTHKGICLSQRKYCLDILKDSGMIDTKPCEAPMIPNVKLKADDGDPLENPEKYRRVVGRLNYLTITRPDIAFPVSVVSQFMSSPRTTHWDAVCHILKYLKGAPGYGIKYQNHGHHDIEGFTDADYDGDPTSRRSTTGYCVFVGGNLVSWKSKKQNVVSRSSAESEYRAMAQTTCELIWLRNLLSEIGFNQSKPMNLWCDNEAAVHIANNPVFHERTKHIEVDCHFTREKLEDGSISTPHIRTRDQLADVFTKALPGSRISYICSKLGMINIYAPA
ncbi:LOW QUALITY PROTEIN: hypothetical protein OSB04_029247 [Centaurea solstitialis]|uniref:Integrase catalytic domain-containing protein n=1 Tax=Centaurea solstitialis TaxID=347529 RepID=A0AA38SU63_9ASTR|nr:LOW QUALITY PROTEIN: hypothetical protein OSB04_029247 [Centaurea solstitialis]